jgi:uncharacterized protein (DUF433 family)
LESVASLFTVSRASRLPRGLSAIARVTPPRRRQTVVKSRVTSYDARRVLNMATLDWSQCPAVESVPGKVSGAWVLKGTRMPVSAIFENLEAGANINDIMEWFDGLDREQVKAVIEFAARSLDKPPEYARVP